MENTDLLWHHFATANSLTEKQLAQFKLYYKMLIEAQELFNITTITSLPSVLAYHFEDSFCLKNSIDMNAIAHICDVGSGGGFPGIPLKIIFPDLKVTLIEVTLKKVNFLQEVIKALDLKNIEVSDLDWRTFLRKSTEPIDLFCSRASLHPDELIRMFSPSSPYKKSTLVYWASRSWQPEQQERPYLQACHPYTVGNRERAYCIFSAAG